MSPDTPEALVARYLADIEAQVADLPAARRTELLADLREHLDQARHDARPWGDAQAREALARLGDPRLVAEAARLEAGTTADAPAPGPTGPGAADPDRAHPHRAHEHQARPDLDRRGPARTAGAGRVVAVVAASVGVVLLCAVVAVAVMGGLLFAVRS